MVDYVKYIVSFLVAAIPVAMYLLKRYFKQKDRRYVDGKKLSLTTHSLNRNINNVEYLIQNEFFVKDDLVKQNVFKDIMLFACETWQTELNKLVKNIEALCPICETCDKESLMTQSRNLHIDCYVSSIKKIANFYREDHFTESEAEIVKRAIQIFQEAERSTLEYIRQTFEGMHNLTTFNFCIRTVTANILTMYETMIIRMIINVDDAVMSSNGYFKNKNYRGSNSFVEE